MSSTRGSNFDSEQWNAAAEKVYSFFESKWKSGKRIPLEKVLPLIPKLIEPFGADSSNSQFMKEIVAELIRIEMALKFSAGLEIDPIQYRQRLFGFDTVIDDAIEEVKRREQGDPTRSPDSYSEPSFAVPFAALTQTMGPEDDKIDPKGKDQIPDELGRFQNIKKVNSGNFGIVCSAFDNQNSRTVALKFPRKKVLNDSRHYQMFLGEAEHSMKLNHPGIVQTYGIEEIDGFPVIVQQFVDGKNLHQLRMQFQPNAEYSDSGQQRFYEIAKLVARIADALDYAHRKGVYHRDLKPENILMLQDEFPLIADFGLALDEDAQLQTKDSISGTAPYMSPEAVAGRNWLMDGRTDIWSLGVILYKLLTGKLPFKGLVTADYFRAINTRDPKPLRQFDLHPRIPKELERICFYCLEKPINERYSSADDIADDLRHWMEKSQNVELVPGIESPETEPIIFPKGLRAYGPEDSDFFLSMLPGQRDREKIPTSIRFWKVRIEEPVAQSIRVPIGVIYGPSGSGKSSFMKAGLLPQLSKDVTHVYVESALGNTDMRLISELRQQFPGIPRSENITIPEILRGLRLGLWRENPSKILIVLDQFEQRLSKGDDYQTSQLAIALRHCDGENLQCLILIRDDFWHAMSRFASALDMRLVEGRNWHKVDLFDLKHAKSVLARFGVAQKKITDANAVFDETNNEFAIARNFIDQAVDQLAEGHYVICVRLALFAEMFKSRPWTPSALKSVGGVRGVGKKFLEETFDGTGSSNKKYREQKDSAQAILEALLPDRGTDIRGGIKKESDLLEAAQLKNRKDEFYDVIQSLDHDLKLITRTGRDNSVSDSQEKACEEFNRAESIDKTDQKIELVSDAEITSVAPEYEGPGNKLNEKTYYQLTHDYLVPSIRDWVLADIRKTRRGRATLRLRELSSDVNPNEKPKNLPTNLEWLTWQFYFLRSPLSKKERLVMTAGRRKFATAFSIATIAVFLIAFVFAWDRSHRNAIAGVNDLLGLNFDDAFANVQRLEKSRKICLPELYKRYETETDEKKRLALLGIFALDEQNRESTGKKIAVNLVSSKCGPDELKASTDILNQYPEYQEVFIDLLEKYAVGNEFESPNRFRATVSMALLQLGNETRDWKIYAGLLGDALLREPNSSHEDWIALLATIGKPLDEKFSEMFSKSIERDDAFTLGSAIYSFLDHDKNERAERFESFLYDSNDARFDAILSIFEQGEDSSLSEALSSHPNPNGEVNLATRSVALLRFGKPDAFQILLRDEHGPGLRSHAITTANASRVKFNHLKDLYDVNEDDYLRQGILMAMAEYAASDSLNDLSYVEWLKAQAEERCLNDTDPGCFAAAELIARRLGISDSERMNWRKKRKKNHPEVLGNVFINEMNMAFSIIRPPPESGISPFAVSMTEVTVDEWNAVMTSDADHNNNPNSKPIIIKSLELVYERCNRMSKLDKLDESQYCYSSQPDGINQVMHADTNKLGYRLITTNEWLIATNTYGSKTEGFLGIDNALADYFARTRGNCQELQPVASRLPNRFGLFDVFGNAYDTGTKHGENSLLGLGGRFMSSPTKLSASKISYRWEPRLIPTSYSVTHPGLRLTRTFK